MTSVPIAGDILRPKAQAKFLTILSLFRDIVLIENELNDLRRRAFYRRAKEMGMNEELANDLLITYNRKES